MSLTFCCKDCEIGCIFVKWKHFSLTNVYNEDTNSYLNKKIPAPGIEA